MLISTSIPLISIPIQKSDLIFNSNINAELVADLVGDYLFTDTDFVKRLSTEHRNVFRKILDEIKYLCKVATAGSKEARELEKIKKVFEEAYRTETKNPTAAGGVKYSISGKMKDSDIQAVQSIGRKSINAFTTADIQATERFAEQYWNEMGVKSPFFRSWFGDWRANEQTQVQVADQQGDARGVQRNADTGWDIQVSGMVFNETNRHTASYNVAARPYLPYINDIVQKAVLLDSFGIDPNKPKSINSLLMHSMYAVVDIGNGQEILKLYVEEMNDPNKVSTNKRAYQLQNIEKYQPQNGSSQKTAISISSATGNIDTIADLFAAVKQKDANFKPNAASKVVNSDGTPKVMYHGSPEQFTVFDRSKAKGSGLYGRGFYFTNSKNQASVYGNEYSVYLNVKHPLQYGAETVSREQVRSFLEAVAENEDYSIENYGTYDVDAILDTIMESKKTGDAFQIIQDINATAIGDMVEAAELFNSINRTEFDGIIVPTETVVFRPEQIKSATDNVGAFDGGNPDIRYSLSKQGDDIAPLPGNIYGKDVALENIAPVAEDVTLASQEQNTANSQTLGNNAQEIILPTREDIAQMEQQERIATAPEAPRNDVEDLGTPTREEAMRMEAETELHGPWRMTDELDQRVEKLYRMMLREQISEEDYIAQLVKADRLYQQRGSKVEEALERVREAYSKETTETPETEKKMERLTRKVLHKGIMENIQEGLAKEGFDLNTILKNAKNLSTFATVDNTPQRVNEKTFGYKAGQIINDLTINTEFDKPPRYAYNSPRGDRYVWSISEEIVFQSVFSCNLLFIFDRCGLSLGAACYSYASQS